MVVKFTEAMRTELQNYARRCDDAELEAICEWVADRETFLEEIQDRPEWQEVGELIASYRNTLTDEQILDMLKALGPGQPLIQEVFAENENDQTARVLSELPKPIENMTKAELDAALGPGQRVDPNDPADFALAWRCLRCKTVHYLDRPAWVDVVAPCSNCGGIGFERVDST